MPGLCICYFLNYHLWNWTCSKINRALYLEKEGCSPRPYQSSLSSIFKIHCVQKLWHILLIDSSLVAAFLGYIRAGLDTSENNSCSGVLPFVLIHLPLAGLYTMCHCGGVLEWCPQVMGVERARWLSEKFSRHAVDLLFIFQKCFSMLPFKILDFY